MRLKTWRKLYKKTLADVADDLGITGANPSRTVHRHETGETRIDVPLMLRYAELTDGAVQTADWFEVRAEYLNKRAAKLRENATEAA